MPAKLELDVEELIRRYESGETAPKIAIAMRISETSVYNYLKAAGVSRRTSGPDRKYPDAVVVEMYTAGMDVPKIQEKTGIKNLSTFYAILKRNGVPVRLQRKKCDLPEVRQQIIALRSEGLTYRQIAKRIGVNRNYVGKVLNAEVRVDRKERWRDAVVVRPSMSILEMREKGLTVDEISEVTGKPRIEVYEVFSTSSVA